MKLSAILVCVCVVVVACRANAQQPALPPLIVELPDSVKTDKEKKPDTKPPDKNPPDNNPLDKKPPEFKAPQDQPPRPLEDFFGLESFTGESQRGFNPHMMGDQFGEFVRQMFTVCSTRTTTTTTSFVNTDGFRQSITTTSTSMVYQTKIAYIAVTSLGAFNVAENESPRPQDRVFGFYNFFSDGRSPDIGSGVPVTTSQTTTSVVAGGTITTTSSTTNPGVPRPSLDLNREVIGFEKTFFDGRASVELRLPFLQTDGDYGCGVVGDLTLVTKYALLLDNFTGNVFSVGLALTLPTGPSLVTVDGNFRDTLIQPWFGYIYNVTNDFYIQGIHSIVIPTNAQDITLMLNDLAIDYWLYRGSPNQLLSSVVPTLEAHLTTPLNHRGENNGPVYIPDVLVLTTGAHLGVYRNTTVTVGAAVPVTGPSPFAVEAFLQVNWRF
jgi:hypothetical protein